MITINDVAREAGVSITTVSRVLNNNYPVKRETRDKIDAAITKLNFKPNIAARTLITKRSSIIGVLVPSITNLFFPSIVESLSNLLKLHGYTISLSTTGGDPSVEKESIQSMLSRQVDGIIAIDPTSENLKNAYFSTLGKSIPTIIVNGYPEAFSCNHIYYDETIGFMEALEYLYELGHRKIAFIKGDNSLSYDMKETLYYEFLQNKSLPYSSVINIGDGNSITTVEHTTTIIHSYLTKKIQPTAFFACNDLMAIGALNACNSLSLLVPSDISIIGFDNTILSDISTPRLTTVDQHMVSVGNGAATTILEIIKNPDPIPRVIKLNTSLIIKNSCSTAK